MVQREEKNLICHLANVFQELKNFFVSPDHSCYQLLKVVVFSDFTSLFEKKLIQCVLLFIEKYTRKGKWNVFPPWLVTVASGST